MNGQSEDPPQIDLRNGKGVQVGPGINVQFNDFHFSAAGSHRRPVRLSPVRTVSAWDPFDLGIWPVVAIPGRPEAHEIPALPPYIARDHDADIDSHLADTASCMIVVTGTSCTGKSAASTRRCGGTRRSGTGSCSTRADPEQLLELLVGDQLSPIHA
jgi:hypothetical protein